ncbi:conserved hypothetical protein [Ricinus communis]|uniref:DUF674 domain-containing protein n=1 Tax=Ricinus communis TaxID=3988 RepID=B9S380_RICCO|nr:conserved hypothetical protein [Ricinus communis]
MKLKALIDKEKNRVLFAESDGDFVDVLFTFFTMPIGTVIRITGSKLPARPVGCMNNLYASVENLDVWYLRTEACKTMLLHPQNGAAIHCKDLKLKIYSEEPSGFFFYGSSECITSKCKLLSQYECSFCDCGKRMYCPIRIRPKDVVSDSVDAHEGVFLKERTRIVISGELKVLPPSTSASFSLLSKLGVMDASTIEERTFDIGVDEVLNLLKSSLVSRAPLTETLLERKE